MSVRISISAWKTLVILGSTILITMYGETMLIPAIPDIIREFNVSYNTSAWILTSYLIAGAVMTPIAGKLSDIYGRKKIVVIIMMIYIVGISIGGLSPDIIFLVVSRIIQGIGIAMFPIAFGIVRDQFPPEKLAIGVGTFSAMFAAGSVVGLAVGGTIIQSFGWRVTFFSIIPVSVILWIIINKFINDVQYQSLDHVDPQKRVYGVEENIPKSPHLEVNYHSNGHRNKDNNGKARIITDKGIRSIDIKGAIALAVSVTSFLIVISHIETTFNDSSNIENYEIGLNGATPDYNNVEIVYILMSVGAVSLVIFIIIERREKSPLIDFNLMTNKMILTSNMLLLISFLSMFTVYQTIPFLVRSPVSAGGFGGDPIATANIQLPFMMMFLIFAPFSGLIISRLGRIRPTLVGSLIAAIGFFGLFFFHYSPPLVAGTLAIIATGLSLIQVGGFNIVLESTPRHLSGTSLGTTVLLNLIGGAIGPAIAGIIMQMNLILVVGNSGNIGEFPSPQSYNLIFLITALLSLISFALVLIMKRTSTPRTIEGKILK
jgi:MFS family permease